jgi:hypothetical protein
MPRSHSAPIVRLRTLLIAVAVSALMLAGAKRMILSWEREARLSDEEFARKAVASRKAIEGRYRREMEELGRQIEEARREREEALRRLRPDPVIIPAPLLRYRGRSIPAPPLRARDRERAGDRA